MNKFMRSLAWITIMMFLTTIMFSSVYADDNETQTGSTINTNTGSILEEQKLDEAGTGVILLEEPTESQTNSGDVLIETETGSSVSDLEETATGEVLIESEGREKAMEEITAEDEYTEILIKYRDDKINILKDSGKVSAENFIEQKNTEIKPALIKAFKNKQVKDKDLKIQKLKSENNLLKKEKDLKYNNASVLKVKTDFVNEVIDELNNDPNIEHAQPNFQYYPDELRIGEPFNTDLLRDQWNLKSDYGIKAYEAWEELQTYNNVEDTTVAVIDSGVQTDHPELDNVLWNGNTYHGAVYDTDRTNANLTFLESGNPISYFDDHGTHVAGIVAGEINHTEISGVSPNARIMALQTAYKTDDIIDAIEFAHQNEVKVINASWGCDLKNDPTSGSGTYSANCLDLNGDYNYSDASLRQAIADFEGLFVTTAGNGKLYHRTEGGFDMDDTSKATHYPCAYSDELDNVICVGATNEDGTFASYSNYSKDYVDIAAPGTNINSTIHASYSADFDFYTSLWLHDNYSFDDDFELIETSENVGRKYIQLDGDPSLLSDDYYITLNPTLEENNGPSFLNITFSGSIAILTDDLNIEVKGDSGNWVTKASYAGYYSEYTNEIIELGDGSEDLEVRVRIHSENDENLINIASLNVTYGKTGIAEKSGTSMAAPHVAGVAAMIYGVRSDMTAAQVKQRIMDTVTYVSDLNPVSGSHPIKSGGRLNAENAVTGLETYIPPLVLTPTIHAKSTGGNWNSASTWVENRVPNGSDVVEVNGVVSITSSTPLTVAGLLVSEGATLRDYAGSSDHSQTYTLAINGDLLNNGTIQSYDYYHSVYPKGYWYNTAFVVEVLGNIENHGTFNRVTYGYSNLYIKSHNNIVNNGIWSPTGNTLKGNNTRIINTTVTIGGSVVIDGDFEIQGEGVFGGGFNLNNHTITINTPNIPTFGGITSTSSGSLVGSGKVEITGSIAGITSGTLPEIEIVGGGNLQGTLNFPDSQITFSGSSARNVYNTLINGDVEVETGATLRDYAGSSDHSQTYTLTINGDLLNNGTIQSYDYYHSVYPKGYWYNTAFVVEVLGNIENHGTFNRVTYGYSNLYIKSHGDIANNGTWTPSITYLTWPPVPTATEYQFQMTNTSGVWQAEETFTTTQKQVANSLINETHLWRTRAKVNGVYGDWSAEHEIN